MTRVRVRSTRTVEIPEDLKTTAEAAHEKLIEAVAGVDDDLMHKYIEGEEISRRKSGGAS
jgi:elongation factor G